MVSIIVPIYNVGIYLEQCIQSIINQSYKDIEIILVNDGSTDESFDICKRFQLMDDRIVVVNKENGGLVSARKAGLRIAKGELIGYVDGDDYVDSNMFEDLVSIMNSNKVDIVIAGHKEILDGKVVDILKNSINNGLYLKEEIVDTIYPKMISGETFITFGIFSYVWNKLFTKQILINAQFDVPNDITMAEDAACTYSALLKANSIYITDSTNYCYRQHSNSMVKSFSENAASFNKIYIAYKYMFDVFNTHSKRNILIEQLNRFTLSHLIVRNNLLVKSFDEFIEIFPFGKLKKGSNIGILGNGTFGQHMNKRLYNLDIFSEIKVFDTFKFSSNRSSDIARVSEIINFDLDNLLVCFISEKERIKHIEFLIEYGFDLNKIKSLINFSNEEIEFWLNQYGIK